MASRDAKDLTPAAREAWEKSLADWHSMYPDEPLPFLTCTWRSSEEQNELYAQGRTKAGKIVTRAKGGQSNHNKRPSPAMDIAFKDAGGEIHWGRDLFSKFAVIAKSHGLHWGGDWSGFKDYPHYEAT